MKERLIIRPKKAGGLSCGIPFWEIFSLRARR